MFCTFWLGHVLRATTACNFSSLIWPAGSAPAALASLLFDPPEPQIIGKTQCFATFLLFAHLDLLFFWDFFFFDLLSSSLLFSSLTLPISAFHLSTLLEVWLLNFLLPWIYFASHVCVLYICCLVLSARMRGRYLRSCQHGFTCRPSDLLEHFLFSQRPHVFEQLLFQKTLAVTHHSSMDSQILLLWLYADACSARVIGFWLIRHTDHLEKVNRSTSRLVIAEHVRKLKLRLSVSSRQFPSCKMNRDHWNIYWHILKHIGTYRKHIEFDSEVYISLSESRTEFMCSSNEAQLLQLDAFGHELEPWWGLTSPDEPWRALWSLQDSCCRTCRTCRTDRMQGCSGWK